MIVNNYTRRQLTYELDMLDAVSGILANLERLLQCGSISGLLERTFDVCLLWVPLPVSFEGRSKASPPRRNVDFPSWSWAGWIGASTYDYGPLELLYRREKNTFDSCESMENCQKFTPLIENCQTFHRTRLQPVIAIDDYNSASASSSIANEASIGRTKRSKGQDVLCFCAESTPAVNFYLTDTSTIGVFPILKPVDELNPREGVQCGNIYLHEHSKVSDYNLKECDFIVLSKTQCHLPHSFSKYGFQRSRCSPSWYSLYYEDLVRLGKCSILNVMLIQWKGNEAERVALGTIKESAWESAPREKKSIVLV